MRRINWFAPALLAAAALTACGGGETKNNAVNNTANNTSNNTANNTTPTNVQNSTTDVCAGKVCDAPSANCVGQIAVAYSGAGSCEAETGTCVYDAVETRTDCSTSGQTCMAGACVDGEDLCANVTCDSPPVAPMCDAGTAVTFGTGTCDSSTGMCDYTNSEIRTDCVAMSQVCAAGACVTPTPEPNPGELIVTEVMANPVAVGDAIGEWFELFNNTARELDLNGLTIIDDGGDSFAIPAATPMLAAGDYLVLGASANTAMNGGVDVDIPYTGISLANSADELVIQDANMVVIDRVAWDNGAGWMIPAGASMNFGGQYDTVSDDNGDPQFWCAALTTYGAGDFGTPGEANDTCPAPVTVTLYDLADENDPDHPAINALVDVVGVVITALDVTNGRGFIQEAAGGEFSAVFLDTDNVDVSALAVGDVVDISGTYSELQGELAQIVATSITDSGNDMSVAPEVIESSVLADATTAEPWEGVLLQLNEAGVTDTATANTNGEVVVDSNIIIDDLFFDGFASATECEVYATVVGPLNYFGTHKIEPRDAADIGTATMATTTTDIAQAGLAFTPAAICAAAGATVTWTNNDALGHTVTSRLASQPAAGNANLPTAPLFDETLAGNGTATVTFAEAGSYPYRCRPHANMEGIVVVLDP